MKILKVAGILAGIIILASLPAHAFWSRALFQIHQEITITALDSTTLYTFAGQPYSFSNKAITAINAMHKKQDDINNYYPLDHFDSEHLTDGFAQMKDTRQILREALSASPVDQDTVWQFTGMLLHQIQDYYSHSSWVASGQSASAPSGIQNFGGMTATVPTVSVPLWFTSLSYESTNAVDCGPDYMTFVPAVMVQQLMTTGYYISGNAPAGKCNHGLYGDTAVGGTVTVPVTVVVGAKCKDQTPTNAMGIARDAPCFSTFADNTAYQTAHDLAITETQQFVKSITDELSASGNNAGFCALLDLPVGNAVCAGPQGVYTGNSTWYPPAGPQDTYYPISFFLTLNADTSVSGSVCYYYCGNITGNWTGTPTTATINLSGSVYGGPDTWTGTLSNGGGEFSGSWEIVNSGNGIASPAMFVACSSAITNCPDPPFP